MKYHQKLLQNPNELQKLISTSKPRNRSTSKSKAPSISKPPKARNSTSTESRRSNHFDTTNDVYEFDDSFFSPQSNETKAKRKGNFSESTPIGKRGTPLLDEDKSSDLMNTSDSVIHISDGEEDEFSFRRSKYSKSDLEYSLHLYFFEF